MRHAKSRIGFLVPLFDDCLNVWAQTLMHNLYTLSEDFWRLMKVYAWLSLLIAALATAPLTYPGPLQTHAGFTHLYALMAQRLSADEVGWLGMLLTNALTSATLDVLSAWKLVEAVALMSGGLGMFLLVQRLTHARAGLIAATLYALLPYRLMTTYVRGALGEALFWGLLPLGLWATISLSLRVLRGETDRIRRLGMGLVSLLSVLIVWYLCLPRNPTPLDAPVYPFQLFSAAWNYGSRGEWLDAVPLQIGLIPLGLSFIVVLRQPTRTNIGLMSLALACALLSITPFSAWWPWQFLKLTAPWQLIGATGLVCCMLAGSMADFFERSDESVEATGAVAAPLPMLAAVLLMGVLGSYSYLTPRGLDVVPTQPPVAQFSDNAYLVSVAITPTQRLSATANQTLTVTLLWQGLTPFDEDYKVFLHLVDAQEKIWAQRDVQPLDGARPTRTWQRGELLRDVHVLTVAPEAPRNLRLAIGLYRTDNGARLKLRDGADRVVVELKE